MKHWLAGALGALLLAGAAPAQEPSAWEGDTDSGPIVHRTSEVTLADEIEGLRRTRVATIASDDVVASYERREGGTRTSVSVYLFRPGELPEHRLRGSVAAFGELSPIAFVWASGPFDVAGPPRLHGYKGTFKTGIGPDTVMDYLYFFELGTWTVKVRATLSGVRELEQEGRIDAFVRALPWDSILAANGACSGAACSVPAFEPFDHHIMQSTLGPMLFTGPRYDSAGEAALPVATRAEIPLMGQTDVRRSTGEPLLYVTTVPGLATYRLMRIPDVASALVTETFGSLSIDKPIYGLLIRVGDEDIMPRLYHGEPTAEVFAAAVGGFVINEMPGPMVPVSQFARSLPE